MAAHGFLQPLALHRTLDERYPFAPVNVIVPAIGGENSEQRAARFSEDVPRLSPDPRRATTESLALRRRGRSAMFLPMTDLTDRVAVVTGASRGIGAGLVRAFRRKGLRVALCARSEPSADEVPAGDDGVWFAPVDVSDFAAVAAFAREAAERLGAPDLWVNNAGVLEPVGPLRAIEPEAFARHARVNVDGVFHGTRAALDVWEAAGATGTVVNISSGAATSAYEGWGAYCATKAAVEMLTRVTALEEAPRGHRVHALAPGVVATDMQALIRAQDEDSFPNVERFRGLHAEGHLADPESPAPAILRLAFGPRVEEVSLDVRSAGALGDLSAYE